MRSAFDIAFRNCISTRTESAGAARKQFVAVGKAAVHADGELIGVHRVGGAKIAVPEEVLGSGMYWLKEGALDAHDS